MNQENFDYLKNQVKFTGFGEGLESQLKAKIEGLQPEFTLQHMAEYGTDKVNATLHFRRSDEKEMYFFNKYDMSLKKNEGEEIKQTFYVGKDNTFTFKEAYNMMDGRAVNKDLVNKQQEAYNSWVQLDKNDADEKGNFKMKHFHENYGYDLEAVLSKHQIKELGDGTDKERLLESLKKGNKQSVTFIKDGEEQKGFVQANPQYKSVKVFDGKGKEVRQNEAKAEKQETSKSAKKVEKPGDEDKPSAKQNNKQARRKGIKA